MNVLAEIVLGVQWGADAAMTDRKIAAMNRESISPPVNSSIPRGNHADNIPDRHFPASLT